MVSFQVLSNELKTALVVNGKYEPRRWKSHPNLRERIAQAVLFPFETIDEKIWALIHGAAERPSCAVCGKKVKLTGIGAGWRRTCSVKCAAQDPASKKKTADTLLKRYGGHHTQNTAWSKNAVAEAKENDSYARGMVTFTERYGVDNRFQLSAVKKKIEQSNLERRGVSNPQMCQLVRAKTIATNIERYGVSHLLPIGVGENNPMKQRNVVWMSRLSKMRQADQNLVQGKLLYMAVLNDQHLIECAECGKVFSTPVLYGSCQCQEKRLEKQVVDFISSLGISVKRRDRKVLNGQEIDIFCPDQNIGFEFDGVFWHSEQQLLKRSVNPRRYHLDKTKKCAAAGITLFHIFENEWKQQQNIVKSMISVRLGKVQRKIQARKCEVRVVLNSDAADFLVTTHIQGTIQSKIRLGLYYHDELVMLITAGAGRFSAGIELLRMSAALNTVVVGGAAKLISALAKEATTPVITYCDKRWGTGNVYAKLGFTFVNQGTPNYWYLEKNGTLSSRMRYQKHKLHRVLERFDPKLSEWENMQSNGFTRVWDCGSSKWILPVSDGRSTNQKQSIHYELE